MEVGELDFREQIEAHLEEVYSDREAWDGEWTWTLEVENYEFDDEGLGFNANYLMQVDYIDTLPPDSKDALIDFHLDFDAYLEEITDQATQSVKVTVENLSGQPQGMVVA
jgi:hypothetical protein